MRRLKLAFSLIGEVLWRSFGLYVKYLKVGVVLGGAGTAFTGDVRVFFISLVAAFVPALLEAYSEIGEEIARTGKSTRPGIERSFNKAVDLLEKQEKQAENKSSK